MRHSEALPYKYAHADGLIKQIVVSCMAIAPRDAQTVRYLQWIWVELPIYSQYFF